MRARLLVIATVAGAIVLFAWQTISHGILGLPEKGLHEFPNDSGTAAAAHAIRALAPQNGIYFSRYGVFAAVGSSADFTDKTKQFALMMAQQLVVNLAAVFILALLVDRVATRSTWRTGAAYGALALAYMGSIDVSNWIWWNFPTSYAVGNLADQVIGFLLVGATIALIARREMGAEADTAERPGVKAGVGPVSTVGMGVKR